MHSKCTAGGSEVAAADRARLVAALGAVRAEMEAASVAVAGQRDAAAAASGAARRRIARLAAENEALMALSNALHAELGRRMPTAPTPPALLHSAPAANQPPAGAAAEEMSARLGRIEAALAERPAGAMTGAGAADNINVPTLPQADKATLSRDATAEHVLRPLLELSHHRRLGYNMGQLQTVVTEHEPGSQ